MTTPQAPHDVGSGLTPTQIVVELDKYIIGQHAAKKSVAIALRNRWRRQQTGGGMQDEIMPANIIMIGPTGVGKTEIARRLARLAHAPFLKVEVTKFTEVGYVGRDVESMVRDLAELGVSIVRAEQAARLQQEAETKVEHRLLEILHPPPHQPMSFPFMVQGMEQPTVAVADQAVWESEHAEWRRRLRAGEIENYIIDMDVVDDSQASQMGSMFSQLAGDEMGRNLQELMGSMIPRRTVRRSMPVAEARRHLMNEETSRLIDNESVIREAIHRVENSGIIFLDEIDKIAGVGTGSGPDVSREGVQRDLLPIVEGSTIATKYGPVKSDHILFVASGAFSISKPSDLLPELQGRFPIRVELDSLTSGDFVDILTLPENALSKQYTALLASEGVTIEFTADGIKELADVAAELNEEVENIGARRLHTVLTNVLEDIMFDAPDRLESTTVVVTQELVRTKLRRTVDNRERARYVL